MGWNNQQEELVGKTVTAVACEPGGETIKLTLSDGTTATGTCEGDCCSSTWIEDFLNPEALEDATITSVENLSLPEFLTGPMKHGHYEDEMAYYGLAIKTNKGTCTIAYRNSSNGYYGGSLDWSIS